MGVVRNSKAARGWKAVLCSQASVSRTGLCLSWVKAREPLRAVRSVWNLQAATSLNTPACCGPRLSRGGDSVPLCLTPSSHPCKVRPSQDPRAIPFSERKRERGREGRRLGSTCPGRLKLLDWHQVWKKSKGSAFMHYLVLRKMFGSQLKMKWLPH